MLHHRTLKSKTIVTCGLHLEAASRDLFAVQARLELEKETHLQATFTEMNT